ncbi:unnamed protein product [Phytomonas sp. Hart1]|nr:unnamed protein product [Phytomonas sp. Hart1]|eukprot:CCW72319.1 unnamed protein product [Phytomonas sp. isolate Hart1]
MRRTLTLFKQPLEALGLNPKVHYHEREIRDAFRTRAKMLHPDVGGDAEHFKELRRAYEYLTGKCEKAADFPGHLRKYSSSSHPKSSRSRRLSRLRLHVFYEYRSHAIASAASQKRLLHFVWGRVRRGMREFWYEQPLSRITTRGVFVLRHFHFRHPMGRAIAEDDVAAANRLTRLAICWCILRYRLGWALAAGWVIHRVIDLRVGRAKSAAPDNATEGSLTKAV